MPNDPLSVLELLEAAPDGVVVLQRGLIVFINPRAAALLGVERSNALGRPIAAFLPPADAANAGQRIAAMVREGTEFPPTEYSVLADPARVVEIKSITCDWEGAPAVLAFARDVTERKAMERHMVDSDRLSALGTLAAGVAHEINNPLMYVQLTVERINRLIDGLELTEPISNTLHTYLDDMQHGVNRIASITRSLSTFVRAGDDALGPVDVAHAIANALKMVDNDLRHTAKLVYQPSHLPRIVGNAPRLEQVFVNVLINAIKSFPREHAGAHEVRIAESSSRDRVTITITDNGAGIPAHLLGHVFDPFFTTRDVGAGTGLGLSVCKTIVESFGGEIEIESTEHVGTTVRVHLRQHVMTDAPPVIDDDDDDSAVESNGPRLRVLVVDDEPLLCRSLARLLRATHDVVTAASGPEAIAAVAASSFDAIVCDVMMPGMNGDEVYRRVAAEHPQLSDRFVFMSGGLLRDDVGKMLDGLPNLRLAKPFDLDQLLTALSRATTRR